jgi:hypothetical protein
MIDKYVKILLACACDSNTMPFTAHASTSRQVLHACFPRMLSRFHVLNVNAGYDGSTACAWAKN